MIDVVIVNWNAGLQLKSCVESLLAFSGDVLGQIIVVDNGSTDDSLSHLPQNPAIQLVPLSENQGFASGCNAGARLAREEFILFLNPDAAVYGDTLATVYAFMRDPAQHQTGICGVRLLDEHAEVARSCSRFPAARRIAAQSLGLDKFFPQLGAAMAEWDHLTSREVDQVIGAFFLVRRTLFNALAGFDERFFVYYEEVDFAYRAKQAGYRSYYFSAVSAFHLGGGVSNQVKARRLFFTLRSRILYAAKHFSLPALLLTCFCTLLIEPLTRLTLALLRRSASAISETLSGYRMLYLWLPAWIFKGKTR